LYLLPDGTGVVDLSSDTVAQIGGGVTSELAFVRSVTRSLIENIEAIEAVQFLVEGAEQETLAGHISIAQPFR
jgi:hypothetical protein